MNRAYSVLEIREVDEDSRTITGLATTPTPDRMGDIVKPEGAKYALPIPLLWQHDSDQPIGHVVKAKVTKKGIEIVAQIAKGVSNDIDRAWSLIKAGLVRGLSIGFRGLDTEQIPNSWGVIFNSWEWLELSAVTIPANQEATIQTVKKFDTNAPAATSHEARSAKTKPPAIGLPSILYRPKEGQSQMKNIGARIAELEAARKEKSDRLASIQSKALDEGRTKDEAEQNEFDEIRTAIKAIDSELDDLRDVESLTVAPTAKTVKKGDEGRQLLLTSPVKKPALEKGIAFARLAKIKAVSKLDIVPQLQVAEKMYGRDSDAYRIVKAGEQVPGSNVSGNWAYDLVSQEGGVVADFAEYLRPATILGKFGQGGIPALRNVPFRRPLVLGTGGGAAYWVGEGKPKPLTQFDFDRTTMAPLKCATICVLTEENIRDSSPSSDAIVRDELRNAIAKEQDVAFITPSNNGTSNVKPAAITYQAETIVSTGDDEDDVRLDIRALLQKYINANNPALSAVLVMKESTALALSLMVNTLNQPSFPGIGMRGGMLLGIPVITSEHVPSGIVAVVNASDVHYGDDGEITVDMSREASLEFKDQANITQNGAAGTGASLVSLWQNNLVGFRAEHTINWRRRRTSAVAYLTSVDWGGAVPAS